MARPPSLLVVASSLSSHPGGSRDFVRGLLLTPELLVRRGVTGLGEALARSGAVRWAERSFSLSNEIRFGDSVSCWLAREREASSRVERDDDGSRALSGAAGIGGAAGLEATRIELKGARALCGRPVRSGGGGGIGMPVIEASSIALKDTRALCGRLARRGCIVAGRCAARPRARPFTRAEVLAAVLEVLSRGRASTASEKENRLAAG